MEEFNVANQISKYYQSFSGTDTLAFIMMPGSSPVIIGSLTTISYSMYRNKRPVINIGRTNINGVTRGSRIFAGTMIFTLINQHWLKELQEQLDWLKGYDELKVDELPLFDIMIISANEYGNAVAMYIYGIDFTDEAQTISVEDLFTENTFSFVARDVSNFKKLNLQEKAVRKNSKKEKYSDFTQKLYVLDSSDISLDDAAALEKAFNLAKLKERQQQTNTSRLSRDLYYSTSHTIISNEVARIQELLNQTNKVYIPVNGIFDNAMDEAVKKYQSLMGYAVNGVVDDKLYNSLLNSTHVSGINMGVVVNKYGAFVYTDKNLYADIVDVKQYREQIAIYEVDAGNDDDFQTWYKTDTGYVMAEDVYSSYYTGGIIEFPTIQYGDTSAYVTLVQSALTSIFTDFHTITGNYDYETQERIKTLQAEQGMYPSGIVDYATWLVLQTLSGNIMSSVSKDNFNISFGTLPGEYALTDITVMQQLPLFKAMLSCDNFINVKASVVCHYGSNKSETFTRTYTIKEPTEIPLSDFQKAFVYNPKYGCVPNQVDYILYPFNKKPYKWTIKYS